MGIWKFLSLSYFKPFFFSATLLGIVAASTFGPNVFVSNDTLLTGFLVSITKYENRRPNNSFEIIYWYPVKMLKTIFLLNNKSLMYV